MRVHWLPGNTRCALVFRPGQSARFQGSKARQKHGHARLSPRQGVPEPGQVWILRFSYFQLLGPSGARTLSKRLRLLGTRAASIGEIRQVRMSFDRHDRSGRDGGAGLGAYAPAHVPPIFRAPRVQVQNCRGRGGFPRQRGGAG